MRLIKYVALNHSSPCSGDTRDGAVGKDFHNFWSKVFPVGMTSYATVYQLEIWAENWQMKFKLYRG